ncbi:MAG TPA: phosphotransferase [Candidatus Saccharimonadia bacterium]|nr:phosphotransferase [Candidatus Saccharimonadia bacterium]
MNIRQLTKALNLLKPGAVVDAKDITVGLANTSYLLITDADEKYVARQLRMQSPGSARIDAKLQARLKAVGVGTPEYATLTTDDVVGEVDDYNFTISPLLVGSLPDKVTIALAGSFGATLAKIHQAFKDAQPFVVPNAAQWLDPKNARRDIALCPTDLRQRMEEQLGRTEQLLTLDLPRTVIHADLFQENVFAENDEVTVVFDLETVEYTVRLLDIARTYISFVYNGLDPSNTQTTLFDAYNSTAEQPLTPAELKQFPVAVEYASVVCAAWLYNNDGKEFVEPYIAIGSGVPDIR